MKKLSDLVLPVLIMAMMQACSGSQTPKGAEPETLYAEKYRPQLHFSPPGAWMNDPNGMVYFEGEYHLFYQHYPDSTVWGPMHWGHAVSEDLVHWTNLPIALYPDSLGYIFSGSAVIDHQNTSGLGDGVHPPMIAIFTYHAPEGQAAGRTDFQNQGIAYSHDKGRTWHKYSKNPVLKSQGKPDFRDPKVWWHEASRAWIMVLAVRDHVEFYKSKNLTGWEFLSEFGADAGAHGGVWECPDLVELGLPGSSEKKSVLIVNINPGGPNGGSATQYFIGNFDGTRFKNESNEVNWADYGKDNYAGVTWSNNEKDGRTLFIGWMSNWQYANIVPTEAWRSAMTIARELTLVNTSQGLKLASKPVAELEKLVAGEAKIFQSVLDKADTVSDKLTLDSPLSMIGLSVDRDAADADFEIEISNSKNERLLIHFNGAKNEFTIDKTKSGLTAFSGDFPGVHYGKRAANDKPLSLTLILDVASLEMFADGGSLVMTETFFPTADFTDIKLRSRGGVVVDSISIKALKSIW